MKAGIREIISALFIKGTGIEIGAFHSPWPVGHENMVVYVDNKNAEQLLSAHPDLPKDTKIHPIDRIDNGITLETFGKNSLDFIVASHFLEHTPSIITTIENHLSKIRPGGLLIYAVPNRDNPIDQKRDTIFTKNHVAEDYLYGPDLIDHHHEYLEAVDGISKPAERERIAKERLSQNLDIHYHCFSASEWISVILFMNEFFLPGLSIDFFLNAKAETFFVLRKFS